MSRSGTPLCGRAILIVEDEPLIALEVQAAFSAAGASIITAADGAEALSPRVEADILGGV